MNRSGSASAVCAIFSGLIACFILGACSSMDIPHQGGETVKMTGSQLIPNVPFFAHKDFQCGPSSLAGILNYYGKNLSPSQIAQQIFNEKARGTLSIDLALYARDQGLVSQWYEGNMMDLRKNIDQGQPLIAMIDLGLGPVQKPHYIVLVGYEPKGVIINSGKHQHKLVSWNRFQNQWSRSSFWTLRIHPEPKK